MLTESQGEDLWRYRSLYFNEMMRTYHCCGCGLMIHQGRLENYDAISQGLASIRTDEMQVTCRECGASHYLEFGNGFRLYVRREPAIVILTPEQQAYHLQVAAQNRPTKRTKNTSNSTPPKHSSAVRRAAWNTENNDRYRAAWKQAKQSGEHHLNLLHVQTVWEKLWDTLSPLGDILTCIIAFPFVAYFAIKENTPAKKRKQMEKAQEWEGHWRRFWEDRLQTREYVGHFPWSPDPPPPRNSSRFYYCSHLYVGSELDQKPPGPEPPHPIAVAVAALSCAVCHQAGSLTVMNAGDTCPRCKKDRLIDDAVNFSEWTCPH